MQLHIYTDASYLVLTKELSTITGFYHPKNTPHTSDRFLRNGAILFEWKTLQNIVESEAEAEVGGIFRNEQTEIPIINKLESLVQPQKPTPIRTDNSIATGFVYNKIHTKRSKYWIMRYYWIQNCTTQEQFEFYWQRGLDNEAVYFTKKHATVYHRNMRSRYIRGKIQRLELNITS